MESSTGGKRGNKEAAPIMVDNPIAVTSPSNQRGRASKHGIGSWADVLDEDEHELQKGEFVSTEEVGHDGVYVSIPFAGGGEGVDPIHTGGSKLAATKDKEATLAVVTSANSKAPKMQGENSTKENEGLDVGVSSHVSGATISGGPSRVEVSFEDVDVVDDILQMKNGFQQVEKKQSSKSAGKGKKLPAQQSLNESVSARTSALRKRGKP
ncbi:hypothetical protein NE237_027093 [Protea cynaroides]|uniref:Uncharacterized protein n=1 Tax=Protea cynaroides TaxID=273540 RepID=A0A9Q0GNN5_9MAGN|nr:hypothetical protein NE237_027093 [Protea cynaroides]